MNEATIKEMEARSAGFHHLEEIVSAPVLLKGLTVHLREVSTLLNGSADDAGNGLRRRLIVVAGESSVLAGWLASDIGDSATARNFYDTAVKAAKEADDPAIAACALAYRSYIPSTKGANGRARILLTEALENISETESPATVAWIAARHAEESAQLGDNAQALASWGRAEDAFSICDPDEDRAWTRFLDQNRFDSYRIATYSKIGRLDEAQEIANIQFPDRKPGAVARKSAGRLGVSCYSRWAGSDVVQVCPIGPIPPVCLMRLPRCGQRTGGCGRRTSGCGCCWRTRTRRSRTWRSGSPALSGSCPGTRQLRDAAGYR